MKVQKINFWGKTQKFFLHPVSQVLSQTLEKKEGKSTVNSGREETSWELKGGEEED